MNIAFVSSRRIRVLTVLLGCQVVGMYALSRPITVPPYVSLDQFPDTLDEWQLVEEMTMDPDQKAVLMPDDAMIRTYRHPRGSTASLFVAYFRDQNTERAPHSPQNCLPGAGWTPSDYQVLNLASPGEPALPVNRYIIEKGGSKVLVWYWYQTSTRVIAKELQARAFLAFDSIRLNRSDTALVRILLPLEANSDNPDALARSFARVTSSALRRHIH